MIQTQDIELEWKSAFLYSMNLKAYACSIWQLQCETSYLRLTRVGKKLRLIVELIH